MPPPISGAALSVAAFVVGGHGKPDLHAQVTVTQPPQTVQLAYASHGSREGWWFAPELFAGTYVIAARVPHQACASVTLTVPPVGPKGGGLYEVRIFCKGSRPRKKRSAVGARGVERTVPARADTPPQSTT
jgi:hypothetical protein